MSDDQFTKLFKYMQEEFAKLHSEMDQRFAKVDGRFDQLYGLTDQIIKRQETDEQERLAMNRQLDRHERWINQAGERLSIRY